jgi:hypothetical protein|tara:strand:- start:463 stop:657 length:195 start_codon:yes stop_codon:yes gene_type:complete
MKYKNKDGIELSYEGHKNDASVQLVKEVVKQAIKVGDSNINTRYPMQGWLKVKKFLTDNFSLDD